MVVKYNHCKGHIPLHNIELDLETNKNYAVDYFEYYVQFTFGSGWKIIYSREISMENNMNRVRRIFSAIFHKNKTYFYIENIKKMYFAIFGIYVNSERHFILFIATKRDFCCSAVFCKHCVEIN